jgi:SAM-dependent methyltransferase
VGDYIDTHYQEPGATQATIDQMAALGVFKQKIERVCEIGPGSGRYLEKTLQACKPDYYEFYETASEWAQWLVQNYHVKYQPTDGISLASTPDASIDLVQAHRVFSYVPFFTAVNYYFEMMRVVRDGGKIVFDILTEDCMDNANLTKWLAAGFYGSSFPSFMSKQYTLDIFQERGFTLVGNFYVINKPGVTEYYIFAKS